VTDSFPFGSGRIDLDLSQILHTPLDAAEALKKAHGWCSYERLVQERSTLPAETVSIPSASGKDGSATVEQIAKIVTDRAREILEGFARKRLLEGTRSLNLAGGVVLSGGAAEMKDLPRLCEEVFNAPARVGFPARVPGLEATYSRPEYAVGVGLLLLAAKTERAPRKKPPLQKLFSWVRKAF